MGFARSKLDVNLARICTRSGRRTTSVFSLFCARIEAVMQQHACLVLFLGESSSAQSVMVPEP